MWDTCIQREELSCHVILDKTPCGFAYLAMLCIVLLVLAPCRDMCASEYYNPTE